MRIDLHVHTRERSPCARSSTDDMIRTAIDAGLDALVLNDHDHVISNEVLNDLNEEHAPFRIFGGTEVTTHGEHILVLGVTDRRLEDGWWAYPDLHTFVNDRGGFLAVAHPFRFSRACMEADLDRYPPHALEVHSCSTPTSAAPRIRSVAARLGVSLLSNSDAHHVSELGDHYNVLEEAPTDLPALVQILKDGRFEVVAPGR